MARLGRCQFLAGLRGQAGGYRSLERATRTELAGEGPRPRRSGRAAIPAVKVPIAQQDERIVAPTPVEGELHTVGGGPREELREVEAIQWGQAEADQAPGGIRAGRQWHG